MKKTVEIIKRAKKMISKSYLLFIFFILNFSALAHKPNFSLGYSFIYSKSPILSWTGSFLKFSPTHSIKIHIDKKLKNEKFELLGGISYMNLLGKSENYHETIIDCNNQFINYSWNQKLKINVLNLGLGFQFKPFLKNDFFYIRTYFETGIVFNSSITSYTPETCFYRTTFNKYYKQSFIGNLLAVNKIKLIKNNFILDYGIVFQLLDYNIMQLNGVVGLEFIF